MASRLAGARKAGQDLGVNVIELGAQSEIRRKRSISILAKAVARTRRPSSSRPRNLQHWKPIDEGRQESQKIIGIDSAPIPRL